MAAARTVRLYERRMALSRTTLVLLAAVVAGCGGGDSGGDVGGALPACANDEGRVELPDGVPIALPLPPGLVLTDAQRLAPGQFHLRGVVRGDLDGVAGFFKRRLPQSGFRLGRGDAEAHEQESPFTGRGYRGSWRVVKHPGDCPVVAVFVVLIAQG
jgi:hypothetical protein